MSSAKGNTLRTRAQKHQNRGVFKNDLHDKSTKTKMLNSLQLHGICLRCKDIIAWKIKYKKYKVLSAPKTCVRCEKKAITSAYHVMCGPCAKAANVCAKCCASKELLENTQGADKAAEAELKETLKALPERKRRTLIRYLNKQAGVDKKRKRDKKKEVEPQDMAQIEEKIEKLKLDAKNNMVDDYGSDDEDYDSDCHSSALGSDEEETESEGEE